MEIRKIIFLILASLLVLMTTGCATFKSEIIGKFNSSAGKNYGSDDVSIFFIISHLNQSKGYDAIPKLENKRQIISGFDDIFKDALNEFSNIKKYSTFTNYASDVNNPERRDKKDSLMQKYDFVIKIKLSHFHLTSQLHYHFHIHIIKTHNHFTVMIFFKSLRFFLCFKGN